MLEEAKDWAILDVLTFIAESMGLRGISPSPFTKPKIISDDLCIFGFMWEKLVKVETYKELFTIYHGTVEAFQSCDIIN